MITVHEFDNLRFKFAICEMRFDLPLIEILLKACFIV